MREVPIIVGQTDESLEKTPGISSVPVSVDLKQEEHKMDEQRVISSPRQENPTFPNKNYSEYGTVIKLFVLTEHRSPGRVYSQATRWPVQMTKP